ncbi:hypothetical protein CVT25_012612 [Psilocybe cyanescens]|uniref:Uncharacterized protein n=1 Tax=Psilocybe cyanescens TaxID=93625 RepID=A0A409W1N2_PSICY|nr:hypothetical protein CVT25_012612 [Psilocybe cyanescens]
MAYAESPFGEFTSIELNEIGRRQDCEANVTVHNSDNQPCQQWDEIMIWLVKAWSITCTGCIILLPFPLSFFQISGINANIYARTAVLSMLICAANGLMIAGFYLQMKHKFKSETFIREWLKASRGLNNRDAVEFWTCLCLPASLFVWWVLSLD